MLAISSNQPTNQPTSDVTLCTKQDGATHAIENLIFKSNFTKHTLLLDTKILASNSPAHSQQKENSPLLCLWYSDQTQMILLHLTLSSLFFLRPCYHSSHLPHFHVSETGRNRAAGSTNITSVHWAFIRFEGSFTNKNFPCMQQVSLISSTNHTDCNLHLNCVCSWLCVA